MQDLNLFLLMNTNNKKRPEWSRMVKLAIVSAIIITLDSCAHESTRELSPNFSESGITRMKSFYVRRHADDDYKLGEEITSQLQVMGYQAICGSTGSPPVKVDAVITYMDKWTWDMTMYLLSLDVQLRQPGSDATLATAKTLRTSAVRRSQKEMVRETLAKLLEDS